MSKRAYRYRWYPTDEQVQMLARTFGCTRFVYNWALKLHKIAYVERSERLSYHDVSAALTALKKEVPWLNEVSSVALQQSVRHLETAFKNFFEGRAAYPVFKKKHTEQSATYTNAAFGWNGTQLTLAKMKDPLALVWSRPLPKGAKPSCVTVSKDRANRYFVSILIEQEIQPKPFTTNRVGIDVGITSMLALSTGETVENPRFFAKHEKKLAQAQRRNAKKKKGSKNRRKAQLKVARLHARIADKRRDFQHKLSTRLVNDNQVMCIETLSVKNMLKNHSLAKSISDVGWSEFIRQLEYKAKWYGRSLIKIDRWYPSSKTCSACQYVCDSLSLDVREWTCPQCGTCHERDINAATNILAEGLSVAACGGRVRPVRAKARRASPVEAGRSPR